LNYFTIELIPMTPQHVGDHNIEVYGLHPNKSAP